MPIRDVGPGNVRRREVADAGPRETRERRETRPASTGDGVDRTPGTAQPRATITGPYAALAKRGDFSGYVMTATGQELFVSVRLAKKNAGTQRPLVYLDGLAARRSRSDMMADKLRDDGGHTVISILLPGQGETLLRDLQKTRGRSISNDLRDTDQAAALIATLDALGVIEPVDIFGLSYGGAIAAATERDHPNRIETVLLAAPHTKSQARDSMGEGSWQMMNSAWNPMGQSMYRSAAKSALAKAFAVPELFKDHKDAFPEALFRLSIGIDRNELKETVRGLENIHVLVAPGDGASPPKDNEAAVKNARSGTFELAPKALEGQHDIVSASPELIVDWVGRKLK
jgi:pimeloyl-ACP methyl ester carboxylesterase